MKTEQKAEMTKEEFSQKWPYRLEEFIDPLTGHLAHIVQPYPDECLSDLRSVIRGMLPTYEEREGKIQRLAACVDCGDLTAEMALRKMAYWMKIHFVPNDDCPLMNTNYCKGSCMTDSCMYHPNND